MGEQPTELAITLAALPGQYSGRDGWMTADETRHRLGLLGFDCSPQFVAATLARMARVDVPWIERRQDPWGGGPCQYRVTRWGSNDIHNRMPSVRAVTPWLTPSRAAA